MEKKDNAERVLVPLSRPDILEDDINEVVDVLKSGQLSLGPKLVEFEQEMAKYVQKKFAIGVNSGTSGLFLSLLAQGIGRGDEVIVPSFTFIATANVVKLAGAQPVFVDIKRNDLNIDPGKIRTLISHKTKAIIPVDVFGVPSDMRELREIADEHGLFLLDDSCEALGAMYHGKHVGSDADVATFAFYPNKQITTGEGGIIATDDEKIDEIARSLRNQGRDVDNKWLVHKRVGYNFRLSDINAALGLSQLRRIDDILSMREHKANYYNKRFTEEGIDGLELPPSNTNHKKTSWFVYVIRLPLSYLESNTRYDFIERMKKRGIDCRAYFEPIHKQPIYSGVQIKSNLVITEEVAKRTVAIPFYTRISQKQQDFVVDEIKAELTKN